MVYLKVAAKYFLFIVYSNLLLNPLSKTPSTEPQGLNIYIIYMTKTSFLNNTFFFMQCER